MTDNNIEKEEGNSRVYEVGYLLLPSIPEEKISDLVSAIKKMIAEAKGEIISQGDPQSKTLSYEMVKTIGTKNERFRTAYFGWIKFEMDAENILGLQEKLRATQEILRFLLIKTVREDTTSSFVRIDEEDATPSTEEPLAKISEDSSTEDVSTEELDKSIDEMVAQ